MGTVPRLARKHAGFRSDSDTRGSVIYKDTTPSKFDPSQWRSWLNLVLYFPPLVLSPISEE